MPLILPGPNAVQPVPYGAGRCRAPRSRFRGDRVVDGSLVFFHVVFRGALVLGGSDGREFHRDLVGRIRQDLSRMPF